MRTASRAHYERNKHRIKRKARDHSRRQVGVLRALVVAAKSRPCTDCAHSYPPYIMEWDHLDGTTKRFNVSDVMHHGYSAETLAAEMAKCELVCANCHRERTHQRRVEARKHTKAVAPSPRNDDIIRPEPQLDLLGLLT